MSSEIEWANKVLSTGSGTAEEIERASNTPGANVALYWEGVTRRQKEEARKQQQCRWRSQNDYHNHNQQDGL